MGSASLTKPSSLPNEAHFKEEKAGVQKDKCLANTLCLGEIRFLSQPQAPTPTNISVLRTPNGMLKRRAIRVLGDLGEFDLACQDSVWLGLKG